MGKKLRIAAAVMLAVSICGCAGTEKRAEDTSDRLKVVTTMFPYYDFARAVAGDLVDLRMILPAGQESHSFEPTASDLIAMEEADVLICNGGESEEWVYRVLEAGERDGFFLAGMDVVSLYEEETTEHMK